MPLRANAINRRFDPCVEQFDDHHNHHRTGQQSDLYPALAQPEGQGNQYQRCQSFLAECGFVPAGLQTFNGITSGMPDAVKPFAAFARWLVMWEVGWTYEVVVEGLGDQAAPVLFLPGSKCTRRVPAHASCQNCCAGWKRLKIAHIATHPPSKTSTSRAGTPKE